MQCNTVKRQSCNIQACTLRAQCRRACALQGFTGCDRDSATFYENIVSARTTDQPNAVAAVLPGGNLGPGWGACGWEADGKMALSEVYCGVQYVCVVQESQKLLCHWGDANMCRASWQASREEHPVGNLVLTRIGLHALLGTLKSHAVTFASVTHRQQ